MNKHDELPTEHSDPLIAFLHKSIKVALKVLAVLMILVIFFGGGVADVVLVLYNRLVAPPVMLLGLSDIFKVFAAFLVVLIAIEIYQNIVLYLRTDVIPVKLVVATGALPIC